MGDGGADAQRVRVSAIRWCLLVVDATTTMVRRAPAAITALALSIGQIILRVCVSLCVLKPKNDHSFFSESNKTVDYYYLFVDMTHG